MGFRLIPQHAPVVASAVPAGTQTAFSGATQGITSAETLRLSDFLFESAFGEYASLQRASPGPVSPPNMSQEAVVRRVESLRANLRLTTEEAAAMVGFKARRYQEMIAGKAVPRIRLTAIDFRVSTVEALAARDWQTAVTMVRERGQETIAMLDAGRLGDLAGLFRTVLRERTDLFRRVALDAQEWTTERRRDIAAMLDSPSFDAAAQLIHWIGPGESHFRDRALAAVELASTYRSLEADEEVPESFDFLFGLDSTGRTAFRARAEAAIRGRDFDRAFWTAFVQDESERAWDTSATVRLSPVKQSIADYAFEDEGTLHWRPDLSAMGPRLRLYDRRRR